MKFIKNIIVGSLTLCCLFWIVYPVFSSFGQPNYMIEWVLSISALVTFCLLQKIHEYCKTLKFDISLISFVVISIVIMLTSALVRRHAYLEVPCTKWEKYECSVCYEYEYSQSGQYCIDGGVEECEMCIERVITMGDQ